MKKQTQPWCRNLVIAAALVTFASCNKTDSSAATGAVENKTVKTGQTLMKQTAVKMSRKCKPTNLEKSVCMIEMLLADISANYGWVSGGGVSEIRQLSGTSYQITLPQEGRDDIFTYEFKVETDGTVTLTSKKESTKSY
jgi:hypothetical protein